MQLLTNVPQYSVGEISFTGPSYATSGAPAEDVDFWATFRHEGGTQIKVWGFYDGNGAGGSSGNVFKIRFNPILPGRWDLTDVYSNKTELNGQKQGDYLTAVASSNRGFWEVDANSAGKRWYKRSDGSHPYIYGNTHYTFLSESKGGGASNGSSITTDINNNATYYNKLRFSVVGDLYPHPTDRPFFDSSGNSTNNGDHSHHPNAAWFFQRVDLAVKTAFDKDMIADLILGGPDTESGRSTLAAAGNDGDATPYLKYIAARYGAFPNVWLCLINEYNTKAPAYSAMQIKKWGSILKSYLPYPTPLSVHNGNDATWNGALNTSPSWNDHAINQFKIKTLGSAADTQITNYANAGADKPSIDDELGYQGAGDGYSEEDVIEGHLGAFVGGGYGSTGYKHVVKDDQYFWGHFNAAQHSASDGLRWLRQQIDAHITFWNMEPGPLASSIFRGTRECFRVMQWPGNEYVLATNERCIGIRGNLPAGTWTVTQLDAIARTETTLSTSAAGAYTFDAPASRAVLFHFKKTS